MIQGSVQKYSPRWVANWIKDAESKVFARAVVFMQTTRWVHLINLAIFLCFLGLTFYFKTLALHWGLEVGGDRLALINRYSGILNLIFLITALGTFAFYLKPETLATLDMLAFIIGLASLYFLKGFSSDMKFSLSFNLIIVFCFFLMFYVLRKSFRYRFLKWDFLIAAFLALAASRIFENYYDLDTPWFFDIARMLFIFAMLTAEYQVGLRSSTSNDFSYVFSAMNLVTPVPVEARYRDRTDSWSVRLEGLRDIIVGLVLLILAQELKGSLGNFPVDISFQGLLGFGFINYIYYYLGSHAWIAVPVGVGRWFGMKLPAFFDFPLLACSPSDRWRRWNIYYYNWFYKILFFPIFKKTRSLVLATFAVFCATLIMHAGRHNYAMLMEVDILRTRTFILMFSFFAVHTILIYVGIKFPKLWPSENSRWGWIGVAVMTILMSFVHIIAPK